MTQANSTGTYFRLAAALCFALALLGLNNRHVQADSTSQIKLDASGVAPRGLEDETQQAVVRDYARAWNDLARAFEFTSPGLLDGYFVSNARTQLGNAVKDQARAKLVAHYAAGDHNLKAVFYSPEGDVLELHDSVRLTVSLTDGSKPVAEQSETRNYVVLMTPGADRWIIRQLQQVQQF
jgi:hypothetical protein